MERIDWRSLKEADLIDADSLEKAFRKYLRKECEYTAAEAKFAAAIIREPFHRNEHVCDRTFEGTVTINSKEYEVFLCTAEDTSPKLFVFYTFVDVESKGEPSYGDELITYLRATKKFFIPNT